MKIIRTFTLLAVVTFWGCDAETTNNYIITDTYIPCGWMGCGSLGADFISLDEHWEEDPHEGKDCFRLSFKNCDDEGTGIYWINREIQGECNWGDDKGNDFSTEGFSKLTFWARGEQGTERIKFGIGGIKKSAKLYEDSLEAFKFVNLTKNWKQYTISLNDKKLHSVIGGFYWYAAKSDNPQGGTFYVDEVKLE